MIKGRIDKVLSQYFTNYDKNNLKLGLLSGKIVLENLYFNVEKINRQLELADVPIKLKYGLLTKLEIKISYMNIQLERLNIKDLILILEPSVSYVSQIEDQLSDTAVKNLLKHLMKNFENMRKGRALQPNPYLNDFEKQEIEARKEAIKNRIMHKPQQNPRNRQDEEEEEPVNILGSDLYELIFRRLEFFIDIEDVVIYYEYDKRNKMNSLDKTGSFKNSFSLMFNMKGLSFRSVRYNLAKHKI